MDLPREIVDQFNAAIKPPVDVEALKALYAQNVDFFTKREEEAWVCLSLLNPIDTQALENVFGILIDVIYIPAYIHLYTSSGFDDAKDYYEALFDKVYSGDTLRVDLLTKFVELVPFDEKYLYFAATNYLFAKALLSSSMLLTPNEMLGYNLMLLWAYAKQYKNLLLLEVIYRIYQKNTTASVSDGLPPIPNMEAEYHRLAVTDNDTYSKYILPYQKGLGNLAYEDALLFCAALKDQKSALYRNENERYDFNPIILDGDKVECAENLALYNWLLGIYKGDIVDYENVEKVFVVTGNHWFSGMFRITKGHDNKPDIKIMIYDPLGDNGDFALEHIYSLNDYYQSFATIYYDPVTRQNDLMSCQVFALQAAKELHTMHRYLPEQYQGDLYLYLSEQAKSMTEYKPDNENMHNLSKITFTRLPPRMIRSMQSTTLYQERESKPSSLSSYGENENVIPVNKKGELPVQSAQKYFLMSQELSKLQNRRIDAKFDSMFELIDKYLRTHTKSEIEMAINQFTLKTFLEQFKPEDKPKTSHKRKRGEG